MIHWKERLTASGIHFCISLAIAALAALLVFGLWYPWPYREVSGGRELFVLVVTVDVLLGPLITLAIFNRAKPRRELVMDLAIVGAIQLAALGYGLWTVAVARPVHLVFEFDRFRVVHAIDIPQELLGRQPEALPVMPWMGPTVLAVRPFRDPDEKFNATVAALQGVPVAARPDLWQSYEAARARVIEASRPAEELKRRFPARAAEIDAEIDAALKRAGRPPTALRYLPVVARKFFWTALLDSQTAEVITFIPLDSF